jgi:hypothetical protein
VTDFQWVAGLAKGQICIIIGRGKELDSRRIIGSASNSDNMSNHGTKAPCRNCHRETKHEVIATRVTLTEREAEGYGTLSWEDTFEMLECCGCEAVMLRRSNVFSEEPEEVKVSYYPPMVSRRRPTWQRQLRHNLSELMTEIYSALDADNRRLALMGARTVVDIVLVDKLGDKGTFAEKLEALERQGLVGPRNREFLTAALEAGNAAAHRGFKPSTEDLGHVMDIVENVLQAVYLLEKGATRLKTVTPSRRKP